MMRSLLLLVVALLMPPSLLSLTACEAPRHAGPTAFDRKMQAQDDARQAQYERESAADNEQANRELGWTEPEPAAESSADPATSDPAAEFVAPGELDESTAPVESVETMPRDTDLDAVEVVPVDGADVEPESESISEAEQEANATPERSQRSRAYPDAPAFIGVHCDDWKGRPEGQRGGKKLRGVQIHSLIPGTAAVDVQLRKGDIILAVNGKETGSYSELRKTLDGYRVGDHGELLILRGRETMRVPITFCADPEGNWQERHTQTERWQHQRQHTETVDGRRRVQEQERERGRRERGCDCDRGEKDDRDEDESEDFARMQERLEDMVENLRGATTDDMESFGEMRERLQELRERLNGLRERLDEAARDREDEARERAEEARERAEEARERADEQRREALERAREARERAEERRRDAEEDARRRDAERAEPAPAPDAPPAQDRDVTVPDDAVSADPETGGESGSGESGSGESERRLTLEHLLDMKSAGLSDETIRVTVGASKVDITVSLAIIRRLQDAGFSDELIDVILDRATNASR